MSVETLAREKAVSTAIREISHIATLPQITLKIIQLVENPNSTAQDLHHLIANDPALCTRILKVVNSAFYGLPGQIGSINRAIVLLGLNAVKNIAIAASLTKLFKGGELTPNLSAKDLWTHAMSVAAGTKMIADKLKLGLADEAFLAGLLHDVGIMVELQYDRNRLVETITRCAPDKDGRPTLGLMEAEQAVYGATHQDFGMALCEKWKFPKSFQNVTGFHHRPMDLPGDSRLLPCMIFIADHLAARLPGSFRLDVPDTQVPQDVLDTVRVSAADLEAIFAGLPDAVKAAEQVMS
ncbi:MAG: HDOD domain-containing protein [Phycisphaerae bacterium]|nr:HDOD domain-containing protein [Phycisphaerae bacterium]